VGRRKNKMTKKQTSKDEVRKMGMQSFAEYVQSTYRANDYYTTQAIRDKDSAKRKLHELMAEAKELRKIIAKPLPKPTEPTKEAYTKWFYECKKQAEESDEWVWNGGDKPVFENEIDAVIDDKEALISTMNKISKGLM
jgi:hypothetical protein